MKSYKTIMKEGYFLLEEKRSRFIARARPADTEQEAIDFIQSVKSACWDAAHNCYAYFIESDSQFQRYSDDGEPQGTAGLPILEVIRKRSLKNVVVVVTRYFGGILLGAGGLARAYGKACSGGLDNGVEIWVKPCLKLLIPIEYHLSGKLRNMLMNEGYFISGAEYAHEVRFTVFAPEDRKELLEQQIREITGGVLRIEEIGRENIRVDNDGNILEDKS